MTFVVLAWAHSHICNPAGLATAKIALLRAGCNGSCFNLAAMRGRCGSLIPVSFLPPFYPHVISFARPSSCFYFPWYGVAIFFICVLIL